MSIQSELVRIGSTITRTEPVISNQSDGYINTRWANVRDFSPGLCVEAICTVTRRCEIGPIASMRLKIISERIGEASMVLVADPAREGEYADSYGELFLDHFTQYDQRRDPLVPAGLTSLVVGPIVISPRAILLR